MLHISCRTVRRRDIRHHRQAVARLRVRLVDDNARSSKNAARMGELQVRGPTARLIVLEQPRAVALDFLGEWNAIRRQIFRGRRRLLRLLRPARRHAQSLRHVCLAFEVEGVLQAHPDVLEAAGRLPDTDRLISRGFVVLKVPDKAGDDFVQSCRTNAGTSSRLQISALDRIPFRAAEKPRPARSSASSCARRPMRANRAAFVFNPAAQP